MRHPKRKQPRTRKAKKRSHACLTGTFHVQEGRGATVTTEEGTFPVARRGLREAMNGDTVSVSLVRGRGAQDLAYVQGVIERAAKTMLCRYEEAGPLRALVPLDRRLSHDFFMVPEDDADRRLGVFDKNIVVARITQYPSRTNAGTATIERRIGASDALDLGIETILASYDLPMAFSEAAEKEASDIAPGVEEALGADAGRRDLRDACVFTIDPADARDFDDAVGARRREDGFEVLVCIADVTHYVGWGTACDLEARQRTTSVYLADRVIPMLPEALSCGVCSLMPHEDRLALAVKMELDCKGNLIGAQPMKAAIRSRARLSYDEVDAFLEGKGKLPEGVSGISETGEAIRILDEVAHLRLAIRERRGALDFPSREAKVVLDGEGHPQGVRIRTKTDATSLVEEAMLLANESVAKLLADREVSCAYRVHEAPFEESLAELVPVFRELGLFQTNEEALAFSVADPHALAAVLGKAEGKPYAYLVSTMLLRAQKRAVYRDHNEGHYALGTKAYCHFTSPIRRYPDITVHRALKALMEGRLESREQHQIQKALPQICRDSSDKERLADAAARDSQDVKMAELFQDRIGEAFSGIIDGVERFGLFVTLDDTLAVGLVPARRLGEEHFSYDERHLVLAGDESGRRYQLGQRIAVVVEDVDPVRGRIGFSLASQKAPASRGASSGRKA